MTVRILQGDCRDVLKTLPDDSVHCVVTSPPYWAAQRDYGHPKQFGMERRPEEYVAALVEVFREVRRVLKADGTVWLNLGDSYAAGGKGGGGRLLAKRGGAWGGRDRMKGWRGAPPGFKNKDLCLIPARVAIALHADGWYLRRDIVWEKPNATEPTRADRPCVSHEFIFLLTRNEDYFYALPAEGQDKTVWKIQPAGTFEGHFATFPAELVERCLLRGCPAGGTVLDPFAGAATTGLVADRLQREAILIELNPEYAEMAEKRIRGDSPLFANVEAA